MPLSADEQRLLDQLEASLRAEDPDLARKFDKPPSPGRGPRRWAIAGLCFLAGIALLVVGMLVGKFWLPVLGFLVMFAGVAVVMLRPGKPSGKIDVPDDASALFDR